MNICQYTHKKAFIAAFLVFFCVSLPAYAEPPKEPNLLVIDDEIKEIIDIFNKKVDAKLAAAAKKLEAAYAPKVGETQKEKESREKRFAFARAQLEIARNSIKANALPVLVGACVQIKCDAAKIEEITEAYITKTEAMNLFIDYDSIMDGFVDKAQKQAAEIQKGWKKLDAGIKAVENDISWEGIGFRWFGMGRDFYNKAILARVQTNNIGVKIKEIQDALAKLQEDLDWLKSGVKDGKLTPQTAQQQIIYDELLIDDIKASLEAIIALMRSPELAAVIAEKAPEMNLPQRIKEAEANLVSLQNAIEILKSKESEKKKNDLLKALAVPVKPFPAKLEPQLAIPSQVQPAPKPSDASVKPSIEDPFFEPPTQPAPSVKPSMTDPRPTLTKMRIVQWNGMGFIIWDVDLPTPPVNGVRRGTENGLPVYQIPPAMQKIQRSLEALPTHR